MLAGCVNGTFGNIWQEKVMIAAGLSTAPCRLFGRCSILLSC
ncbi:hypothetical protein HMPREF0758_4633 [Serratia odorifera DSM 4582]|uniref:Uncharacterized protein n=1 Tax=Serratia odorifera DSM 4582 TaxID=667129 RepID=D4E8Y3_SEROD|nr:hypothetical protein HMPREF0758_4633 [Serratia odorifera DSM 4582]